MTSRPRYPFTGLMNAAIVIWSLTLTTAHGATVPGFSPSIPGASGGRDLELQSKSSPAQLTQIAGWLEHGEGVPRDYAKAIQLYCRAAHKDFVPAMVALGWIYANGRGVDRDDDQAAAWFEKAAELGDPLSARLIGRVGGNRSRTDARCLLPDGRTWFASPETRPNPDRATIVQWVRHLAPRFELDAALVLSVIQAESNFNVQARSHKNAQGLMQLIPETARRFGVENSFDPVQNIQGGMAYLRWLLNHFKGDLKLALAGYNAGERTVERYSGVPPYPETRAYIRRVLRGYSGSS